MCQCASLPLKQRPTHRLIQSTSVANPRSSQGFAKRTLGDVPRDPFRDILRETLRDIFKGLSCIRSKSDSRTQLKSERSCCDLLWVYLRGSSQRDAHCPYWLIGRFDRARMQGFHKGQGHRALPGSAQGIIGNTRKTKPKTPTGMHPGSFLNFPGAFVKHHVEIAPG